MPGEASPLRGAPTDHASPVAVIPSPREIPTSADDPQPGASHWLFLVEGPRGYANSPQEDKHNHPTPTHPVHSVQEDRCDEFLRPSRRVMRARGQLPEDLFGGASMASV